jgi:hypothetical protein
MKTTALKKTLLASSILLASNAAFAGYTVSTGENESITFGGFIAADYKYIDGELAPFLNDFWIGTGTQQDTSLSKLSISSSRINTKYVNGETTGFIEMDFYTNEGNEILTNSRGPRIRHAFIKHGNWTVGQTWSTFVNTGALAEAVDFGGPLVASAFVRQTQIRYTNGALQVAIENPESYGGDNTQDAMPDLVGKYTFSGDWGSVSVAGVFRSLNTNDVTVDGVTTEGTSETALGFGVSGKIKVGAKDDLRFQLHSGNTGRYVGAASSPDLAGQEVETATSVLVSYRHVWNDEYRSNVFYGNATTDETDRDRTHVGLNVFRSLSKKLTAGFEVGQFEMAEIDKSSTYIQGILKFSL